MSDFLTEEEQVERIKSWWGANSTSIIVGLVLAVLAIVGWRALQDYTSSRAESASDAYRDYLDARGLNGSVTEALEAINAERATFNEEIGSQIDWRLDPVESLREPSFVQTDLRLYKPFLFADGRGSGQFFFQVFNLLNRENYGLIEGRVTSRKFGQPITLAGPPRTIEIGLKIGY